MNNFRKNFSRKYVHRKEAASEICGKTGLEKQLVGLRVAVPVHSCFLVVGRLERRSRVKMVADSGGAVRRSGLF